MCLAEIFSEDGCIASYDLSNYCFVSNLSFLSTLTDQVILVRLVKFLEENNIVPTLQPAYRRYHSVKLTLCKMHNDLVLCADEDLL